MAGDLPVQVSTLYHNPRSRTSLFSPKLKKTTSCRYQKSAKREPLNGATLMFLTEMGMLSVERWALTAGWPEY
jgi:hypothetical protein